MLFSNLLKKGRLERLFSDGFGVYVHVPFCLRRCKYCAFPSSVIRSIPSHDYANAVVDEWRAKKNRFPKKLISLYFGGGTPSILSDDDIERIADTVRSQTNAPDEATLEANPEHVAPERALRWKKIGFSRISLGVQSFSPQMLAFLGRKHSPQTAENAVRTLQNAGFDEISVDIIYGGAPCAALTQNQAIFLNDLQRARQLGIPHVSCYELTLEPHTPLASMAKNGAAVLCDENTRAWMAKQIPGALDMKPYEISNYTRHGACSAHNLSCWAGVPYLGLGPGAHSFMPKGEAFVRAANDAHILNYMRDAHTARAQNSNFLPQLEFSETLSPQTHLAERLILAARTRLLWNPADIAADIRADLAPYASGLKTACRRGLIRECGVGNYRTTSRGMMLNNCLDEILFLAAPDA